MLIASNPLQWCTYAKIQKLHHFANIYGPELSLCKNFSLLQLLLKPSKFIMCCILLNVVGFSQQKEFVHQIQSSGVLVVLSQAWIEELYSQVLEINLLGEAGYWESPEEHSFPLITMLTGNKQTAWVEIGFVNMVMYIKLYFTLRLPNTWIYLQKKHFILYLFVLYCIFIIKCTEITGEAGHGEAGSSLKNILLKSQYDHGQHTCLKSAISRLV